MNKRKVTISYSILRRCAFIFISLPILCFSLGWLKWYWAILTCLAIVICILASDGNDRICRVLFKSKFVEHGANLHSSQIDEKKLVISRTMLFAIIAASFTYLFFCGVGRLWSQSDDYMWRNAIFRDLIVRKWPVFYDAYDGALSYYIGIWLPAAAVGKIFFLLGVGTEPAFMIGNISLLIYCTIGMSILFFLLLLTFQTVKPKDVILIIAGFVLFSGMDFIGNECKIDSYHIEWWAYLYQYSSLTTCLCWVFNQTLISWICTALLFHEEKVSNFIFIGMACLFSGPFPFIGFFIYCIAIGMKQLLKMLKLKQGKSFFKDLLSISNICSVVFIFPIVGSFLLSNSMTGNQISVVTVSSRHSTDAVFLPPTWNFYNYILYFLFMLFEFGIYCLLIAKDNKKNYLFYVTIIQLMIYPMINVGINSDLTMRSSIPAIFMVYVFCLQYLLKNKAIATKKTQSKKKKVFLNSNSFRINIPCIVLIICLLVGAVTPGVELYRGFGRVYYRGLNDRSTDLVVTLNRNYNPVPYEERDAWPPTNFVSLNYDDTVFFKYFARR